LLSIAPQTNAAGKEMNINAGKQYAHNDTANRYHFK
jgi:hypothetical protein